MCTNDNDSAIESLQKITKILSQWGKVEIEMPNMYTYRIIFESFYNRFEIDVYPNNKTLLNEEEFFRSVSKSVMDLYDFKDVIESMFNTQTYEAL